MHAAEGPQRVDRAVSSPLSIISQGDVDGDGGVTDRATRFARKESVDIDYVRSISRGLLWPALGPRPGALLALSPLSCASSVLALFRKF